MRPKLYAQLGLLLLGGLFVLAVWLTGETRLKNIQPIQASSGQFGADPSQAKNDSVSALVTPIEHKSTLANYAAPQQVQATAALPRPTSADPISTPAPTTAPAAPVLNPAEWEKWPVLPIVSSELRQIYLAGLQQGNNPHAFSVLGDCQSQPDVFMGVFDQEPMAVASLPEELQDTVAQFSGSFARYSPTVKDGTTEGALLWIQWNDNKEKKCSSRETPLDCELRVQKPVIVFIHVGTHYEDRNRDYLVTIIEKILKNNAIPVLVTKADNLEKDKRINAMIALLAAEYNLPLWNFWASVQHLPNHGLKVEDAKYLTDDGMAVHRMGALEALDTVWRALQ